MHCVQTDNGQEFTKRLSKTQNPSPTLFEKVLKKHGISHKLIRPYTPRHNGKVERFHRKDNEYFYASHTFYSFDDFKKQLTVHNRKFIPLLITLVLSFLTVDCFKRFFQYINCNSA